MLCWHGVHGALSCAVLAWGLSVLQEVGESDTFYHFTVHWPHAPSASSGSSSGYGLWGMAGVCLCQRRECVFVCWCVWW